MKRTIIFIAAAAICAGCVPLSACAPENDDASSYKINVTFDGANTLEGSVQFSFFNDTENALDCLKFNLWGNAYREGAADNPVSSATKPSAYYDGESYGKMEIISAEGGQWQVCGEDQNILEMTFDSPIYPDERVTVDIEYTLTLANVRARTGVAEKSVNLGNFYPTACAYGPNGFYEYTYSHTGDPFVSDVADYEVTLTAPEQFVAAASGKLISSENGGGNVTRKYELKNARDFAFVLSDSFGTATKTAGDTQITYYYYDDDNAESNLAAAAASLEYFENTFGQYPYPTLAVAQAGLFEGGMEYPGLTMISDECEGTAATYTIVHENAHQWWYAAVGSDQFAHSWQDEGLAEYSSLMFFENNPEYGFTKAGLLGTATKAYRAYFSVYNQLFGDADTSMDRALDQFSGEYEYANIAYNKALLLFDAVRSACGDEHFKDALKDYYKTYLFKIAPPEGLIACFCRYADCEGIFSSFIEGKVII